MDDKLSTNGGVGLATLLTVLFIALKLTGVIAWSWWWVLSPILITVSGGLLVFLILIIIMAFGKSRGMTFRRK